MTAAATSVQLRDQGCFNVPDAGRKVPLLARIATRQPCWNPPPPTAPGSAAKDINDGLAAANSLNQLLVDAINATGVNLDGWISRYDLREVNGWVRKYCYDAYVLTHGDDEDDGSETGFHNIQNDGGTSQFFGQNLVDTVADGIYHYGFEIIGENFVNEDGNTNQSLSDVSGWLNYFLSDRRLTTGTWNADVFRGNEESDQVLAYGGNDVLDGQGGADLLDGSWGRDSLRGGAGSDQLDGGFDDDWLDGGEEGDTYLASGADPCHNDWRTYSFQGYDTYADSGTGGLDVILAEGVGDVDIGLRDFGPDSGIERICNATEAGGSCACWATGRPTGSMCQPPSSSAAPSRSMAATAAIRSRAPPRTMPSAAARGTTGSMAATAATPTG